MKVGFRFLLPVAWLLLASCATGGGADRHLVLVEVENNVVGGAPVTVRLLASDRAPLLLGAVPGGDTRTFRYRSNLLSGNYRLAAQGPDGGVIQSQSFTLHPRAAVYWSLRRNELFVGLQEGAVP